MVSDDNNDPPSLSSQPSSGQPAACKPPLAPKPTLARAEECSFPSPPSSLLEPTPEDITTTTTATQEGKTDITQVEPDSLFLEITPPDFEDDSCKNGQQQLLPAVVETDSCSKPASTEKKGSIGSSNSNESKKDSSGSCSRRDSRNGNGNNSLKVDMDKLAYDISISRWAQCAQL